MTVEADAVHEASTARQPAAGFREALDAIAGERQFMLLSDVPEGGASVAEIAEASSLDLAVCRSVARTLCTHGVLESRREPGRRRVDYSITPLGRKALDVLSVGAEEFVELDVRNAIAAAAVLSDPLRFRLASSLLEGDAGVSQLADAAGTKRQAASTALAVMARLGVVDRTRRGKSVAYSLTGRGRRLLAIVQEYAAA